jgi:hypothetical protein
MTLPDGLNLRSPNPHIAADQRELQGQGGCRYDSVGHIWNIVPANKLDRVHNRSLHRNKTGRTLWVIQSRKQTVLRNSRQAILLNQVYKFHETDCRNVNEISRACRGFQGVERILGKPGVSRDVPQDGMSIDGDSGHQKSSRRKFFHISRRASSISSADREIPRSAHSPQMLLSGFLGSVCWRSWFACSRSSCCLSGGKARTASIRDCSTLIIRLFVIISPSRRARRGNHD